MSEHLDDLAKIVAARTTRRRAMAGLGALGALGLVGLAQGTEAAKNAC
jgi:hypothetical protein